MTDHHNSPNWYWQRLGYTVEGDTRGRQDDGSTVEVSRHGGEDSYSTELLAVEREYRRLPHGPEECRAAQQDLPL